MIETDPNTPSIPDRVAALEARASEDRGDVLATQLMLRAIIASHPDRVSVREAFRVMVSMQTYAMRESGFQSGDSPEHPGRMAELLEQYADDWLAWMEKPREQRLPPP